MHLFKVTGFILGVVGISHALNGDDACNSPLTVFVTVSETATLTETVVLNSLVSLPGHQFKSEDTSSVPAEITATSTIFVTHANVFSVFEVTSTASADQGPYYFSVNDGTTEWASGKTPPAAYSQVLKTETVAIVPVPSTSSMKEVPTTTSIFTVLSTSFVTNALTETIVETSSEPFTTLTNIITVYLTADAVNITSAAPKSLKSFTGIGSYGWNSSSTVQQAAGVTAGATGTGLPGSHTYATGASGVIAPSFWSKNSAPAATQSALINKMKARQVGAIVTATINGVIVSWTNTYDGSTPTTVLPLNSKAPISSNTALIGSSTTLISSSTDLLSFATTSMSCSSTPVSSTSAPISSSTSMSALAIPFGPPSIRHSTYSNSTTTAAVTLSTGFVSATRTSTLTPSPTSQCNRGQGPIGNTGNLTINFDDLPRFSASPNDTDYPPLFSPYHNLFWANGFAYVPPPTDPYPPVSPPQLAVFVENASANVHPGGNSANSAGEVSGEFGAGSNFADSAFWFDVYSAYLGCENKGPAPCMITMSGFSYEPSFGNQVQDAEQVVYQPPCPTLTNCTMMKVNMNGEFRSLANLDINATVDGVPVTWYMDDLKIGWSNNSCDAVQARNSLTLGFPFIPDKIR